MLPTRTLPFSGVHVPSSPNSGGLTQNSAAKLFGFASSQKTLVFEGDPKTSDTTPLLPHDRHQAGGSLGVRSDSGGR